MPSAGNARYATRKIWIPVFGPLEKCLENFKKKLDPSFWASVTAISPAAASQGVRPPWRSVKATPSGQQSASRSKSSSRPRGPGRGPLPGDWIEDVKDPVKQQRCYALLGISCPPPSPPPQPPGRANSRRCSATSCPSRLADRSAHRRSCSCSSSNKPRCRPRRKVLDWHRLQQKR